jgi:GT2 family glycosyltransferase
MNDTLSVVLPVLLHDWYLYKLTINCINNLRYFTYPYKVQIILVHNQSQLFPQIKSELTEDDIYLPQEGVNLRPGKCLNLGFSHATSDYLCILANDLMVHFDWYKYAKEAIDTNQLDIVIPWLLRNNMEWYLKKVENKEYIQEDTFTSGAGSLSVFKRSTYERIGPFDENLVMVCDRDYLLRIKELSYSQPVKVGHHLLCHATHLGSMTWANNPDKKLLDWGEFEDNVYFNKKWGRNS